MMRLQDLAGLARDRRLPEPPSFAQLRPRLPYPDGWFAVAFADELPPGRMLRRRFMGEDLVVYRTRSGLVRVIEPYCPHLGAHLGYGGRIDGEEIVCPFHHFAFGVDGRCVRTGYGTRPPVARLGQREVQEVNGAIFVWHHAGGAAPTWKVPPHSTDGFAAPFRHQTTLVDHPQEVVENTVDTGHFGPLHGYRHARVRQPFKAHGPLFTLGVSVERALPIAGSLELLFEVIVHGLGHIWATARIPRLGIAAVFQAMATPLDPVHVQMRFSAALRVGRGGADARSQLLLSRLVTAMAGPAFRRDLSQDFPVWEHKVYLDQPRLAKGDGPIVAYRRWARQFYSQPAVTNGRPDAAALSAAR